MLNYPVRIIIKSQIKTSSWSKDSRKAHFRPTYVKLKPNLWMKPIINILFILSIF